MAGNKGFRNLPKLERLKRGRPVPAALPRPSPKPSLRRRAPRSASVSFAAFPPLHQQVIRTLVELLDPGEEAFLVGGAIRDLLLARSPIDDLDFAVPARALATAQALAERIGGRYVCLDAARGAGRVVLVSAEARTHIDLADFRRPSLEGDLRARDLTIDAVAVSARRLAEAGEAAVFDPTGGLDDLASRRLRLPDPGAFADDPVRALRAVRLAALLHFELHPALARAARGAAARLSTAAPERVRDELAGILGLPRAGAALRALDRLGLMAAVLPESAAMKATAQPAPHRFSVWEHSVRAVEAVDRLLAGLAELEPYRAELASHLAEPLGDGVTRQAALKLAALLHDVAKPACRQVEVLAEGLRTSRRRGSSSRDASAQAASSPAPATRQGPSKYDRGEARVEVRAEGRIRFIGHESLGAEMARAIAHRLRLSSAASALLEKLVRQHLRLMHLSQVPEITRRARYRFFRDLGPDARDLLLLTLADAAAVRGVSPLAVWRGRAGQLVADFMRGWQEDQRQAARPPLLRGEDVMAAFGLPPGPAVGRLLALAREAQDLGQVKSREEALAYLARQARGPLTAEQADF
ncbi:MAG: hypothetical protein HY726_01185 [Candidatus Rokubacteria bacterium]|nr:hypothetical protein [Candidatus Rokubacteria bacterium]